MDIDALREYLTENHGAFEKWGNFVAQRTLELLEQKTGTKIDHNFIKRASCKSICEDLNIE